MQAFRARVESPDPALVAALTRARDELRAGGPVSAETQAAIRDARRAGMASRRGEGPALRKQALAILTPAQLEALKSVRLGVGPGFGPGGSMAARAPRAPVPAGRRPAAAHARRPHLRPVPLPRRGPSPLTRGPVGVLGAPMRLGFGEILLILAVALLIFGPSKLPQLGEALGKGIRNFKKSPPRATTTPPPAKESAATELPAHAQGAPTPASKQAVPSERKPS